MTDSNIQKFEFQPEHEDGSLSLVSAVFQALGAASNCWDPFDCTGIFDSERASSIGNALLEKIKTDKFPASEFTGQLIDIGPEAFTNGEVINYKGANFYRACDAWVSNLENGGKSFCVKRVDHPGDFHEDYNGLIRLK